MLEGRGLTFGHRASTPVLREVSLSVAPGEVVGLDGFSGAGKSTLGRILAGYLRPWSGLIEFDGRRPPRSGFQPVQLLFQTPELAVNPRWRIGRILEEAFAPASDLLQAFGLRASWLDRYPHELSGGELQRVAIVRALAPGVRYLVADEISGMLDPITQAEIWAALLALAAERGIGLLVISHDAPLLERIATRRLTLKDGRIVPTSIPSAAVSFRVAADA